MAGIGLAGCGSGPEQSADEPKGRFPVELLMASFPAQQKLAETSDMKIVVRNSGHRKIPVISVTVKCAGAKGGSGGSPSNSGSGAGGFSYRTTQPGVADPSRPQFIVNRIPTRTPRVYARPNAGTGDLDPLERSSAYVDTYPLGSLRPGRTATFRWNVTAVKPGPFHICFRINAGLDGRAIAVPSDGQPIAGAFTGEIAERPPQAHIAGDGKTVVEGKAVDANTP